jgi:hypothetical protein
MPIVDFISPDYEASSPDISARKTINMFPESTEGQGRSPVILKGTPATKTFTQNVLPLMTISTIRGDGGLPNSVVVETIDPHGLTNNQIISIQGTTNYNEVEIGSVLVVNATQFRYSTENNQSTTQEAGGQISTNGDSDIPDATGGCRGLYTSSTAKVFGCYGGGVFEIFSDGSSELKFNIPQASTRVSMTDNGLTLCLVDGTTMYLMDFDTENVTSPVLPFLNPIKVVYSNRRVVCINNDVTIDVIPNNSKYYWCEPVVVGANGIEVWDDLSWASAESSADPIIAMEVVQGQLWFFGTRSYEVWDIDENPDLPYRYVGGSSTEVGCRAVDSVFTIAGKVFWLGSSASGENIIFMSNGYGFQRISNHAIESWLNKLGSSNTDAVGFAYQQEGHTFYCLNFIAGNKTHVFDLATSMWHERATRDKLSNVNNRWEVLFATSGFGLTLCGAVDIPRVFTLDMYRYYEWDGRPIVRMHQSPVLYADYKKLFHKEFQIDMATGVGTQQNTPVISGIQNNQGEEPKIMLQFSDDSGYTWSSELWITLGKSGEYMTRARWRKLGSARFRVYRVVVSDPVQVTMIGARAIFDVSSAP